MLERRTLMDIISAILEIDSKANDMLREGERERDRIIDDAAKSEQNVSIDIKQAADAKIEAFRSQEKDKFLVNRAQIREKLAADKSRLQSVYDENHEKWEEDIFESVISGD